MVFWSDVVKRVHLCRKETGDDYPSHLQRRVFVSMLPEASSNHFLFNSGENSGDGNASSQLDEESRDKVWVEADFHTLNTVETTKLREQVFLLRTHDRLCIFQCRTSNRLI